MAIPARIGSFQKLFLSILCLASLLSMAEPGNAQEKKTGWLGIRGSRLGFSKGEVVQNYGLEVRYYVADNVALNYSLTFGADEDQQFYMHSYLGGGGAGVLAASAVVDSSESRTGLKLIGALLSLAVPEGVTLVQPLSDRISIAPYIEPLGFDIYNGHLAIDLFVSGKVGARFKCYINNKLVVQPYGGISTLYHKGLPLASEFGLTLSYKVGNEASEEE
ncbi:MAG: hypothetical protein ABEH38_08020 [Flavobacteriales bacterium]